MKRMLINAAHPEEIRVAFINGQELYDLDIESRAKKQKLEDIYKANVAEVLPHLSAAFIKYGQSRPGFLSLKHTKIAPGNAETCGDSEISLEKEQEILVQVIKDERDNKGAQLTTDISLKSQHLILHPYNPNPNPRLFRYLQASNRQTLQMLREAKKELSIPVGMGIIIKSIGIQITFERLQKEIDWLLQIWQNIIQAHESKDYPAPRLLYQREPSPARVLRDYLAEPVDEIVVDTPEAFADFSELVDWCLPEYQGKLKLHEGAYSLFREYKIDRQAEQELDRIIRLKSGGTIVIDPTEALTAIDVNSARDKRKTLTTNLEAVDEIARQLRIRDISGLVVVDLIGASDKEDSNDVKKIYERMEENLFNDRALTRIEKISRFGLLEIERQRLRTSLTDTIANICPHCQGKGSIANIEHIAIKVMYEIEDNSIKNSINKINVNTSPEVGSYIFNNKRSKISCIEKKNNVIINIISNPEIHNNYFELHGVNSDNITVFKFNNKKIIKQRVIVEENKNPAISPHKMPKTGFFSKLFSTLFELKTNRLIKKSLQSTQQENNIKRKNNMQEKRQQNKPNKNNRNNRNNRNRLGNKKQLPQQSAPQKTSTNKAKPTKKINTLNQHQKQRTLTKQPTEVSKASSGEHASLDVNDKTNDKTKKSSSTIASLPKTNHPQEPVKPQQIASNTASYKPKVSANRFKVLNDPRVTNKKTLDT